MVQKEIRKKTKIYSGAAVLSALLLVTLIYSLSTTQLTPMVTPSNPPTATTQPISQTPGPTTPQQNPVQTPRTIEVNQNNSDSSMKSFSSIDELISFVNTSTGSYSSYSGGPLDSQFFAQASSSQTFSGGFGVHGAEPTSYSTTNIQVAGVDEADTVKTDGQYIYTTTTQTTSSNYNGYSSQGNSVYVVKADPNDLRVVAKISLGNNTEPAGLFLSPDGSKLVVIGSQYQIYPAVYGGTGVASSAAMPMIPTHRADVYTYINVYDVSNPSAPVLTRNFTVSGSYFNSRMIDNCVYVVVSQPAILYNNTIALPATYNDNEMTNMPPTSIYYADMVQPTYYIYTSFISIDTSDTSQNPTTMTVLMGGASTMYVSPGNIYVTFPSWNRTTSSQYTSIYRVSVSWLKLTAQAEGNVPGTIINQYAMDENNGYLRVVTNLQSSTTQTNNIYVLDQGLTIIGKLEGLAKNENLHSVRFIGDKCYLVTFIKTDPLFVIDLSQPQNPRVLGALFISGYSDYLHPYDDTHLIGVGKETADSAAGTFAWYEGIKLALFDVSNETNPTQLAKYVIGDRGTTSIALSDPKAFLFDKQTGLLVIPINLAIVNNSTGQATASSYGTMVWQGAYVFNVTLNGIALMGAVTHLDPSLLNAQGYLTTPSNYYATANNWITRALYIGNTLYTISNAEIKLNSLTDMSPIGQILLS